MGGTGAARIRHRYRVLKRAQIFVAMAFAVVLLATGCGGRELPTEGHEPALRVGAFDFAESELLSELYAQALEEHGIPVARVGRVGSREVVEPALELGLIDVVPEYAGTLLSFVSLGKSEPSADPATTLADLRLQLAPRGMMALDAAAAQNRNTLVVTEAFAFRHRVDSVSDLVDMAERLSFGGPPECPERYFCLIGLRERYGIEFGTFVPIPNAASVVAALVAEEIDVGLLFSTDAVLIHPALVELDDDLGLQPAENIVPVIREDAVHRWGRGVIDALNRVSSRLDTHDLVTLNAQGAERGAVLATVAAEWLSSP